jgi:hypothetical protein
MLNHCVIGGGSGGGVSLDYWHEHTSLYAGFGFGSARNPPTLFFGGETARPQIGMWQKIRVNPNYLVVFFTVVTPSKDGKAGDRGVMCMLLGYASNHKGDCYRMWNPESKNQDGF